MALMRDIGEATKAKKEEGGTPWLQPAYLPGRTEGRQGLNRYYLMTNQKLPDKNTCH